MNTRTVITEDRKPELEQLIRSLPAILSGRVRDRYGVARGFRARVGWAFFSLVAEAFDEKSRGRVDSAGESWEPLSPEYLAYQRPITGRKPPKGPGKAPGGKNGFLTKDQLRLWRRIYADRYAWFIMREPDDEAQSHAAAVAWIIVKAQGAKTKLAEFGSRKAGVDYSILRDRGTMRQTIQPGEVTDPEGVASEYDPPRGQEFEDHGTRLVVGSNDPKAKWHHNGKGRRERRFWPRRLPAEWWRQIMDAAAGGLGRIGELFGGTVA